MRTFFVSFALTAFALTTLLMSLSSCEKVTGKGDIVSQLRNLSGYTGIQLTIDGTVFFSSDTINYFEIRAQQNIIDVMQTYIEGGDLVIRFKPGIHVGKHEPIQIFVAAPTINLLNISGSGDIFVTNPWSSYYMETNISGSGSISMDELTANEFHATISGSGNIQATTGQTNYEYLNIGGSGSIDLLGVESDTCWADISGSGDITVLVNKLLDVTISGSGDVKYQGSPVIISHISGSGSIIHI